MNICDKFLEFTVCLISLSVGVYFCSFFGGGGRGCLLTGLLLNTCRYCTVVFWHNVNRRLLIIGVFTLAFE